MLCCVVLLTVCGLLPRDGLTGREGASLPASEDILHGVEKGKQTTATRLLDEVCTCQEVQAEVWWTF